jgi:hypothetical protein
MAVFCLWVGLVDALGAEFQSGRVFGWLMLLACPLCAIGAWGLVIGNAAGLARGLLGALTATAVAILIIGVWISGDGGKPWLPLLLALAAPVAIAVWLELLKQGVRPRLPVAATALAILGLLIGLFQFWYEKDYVPSTAEAGLSEQVELTAGPVPDGKTRPEYVTANVTLKNVSGTKVRMMGSHYNVWNYEPGKDEPQTFVESGQLNIPTGNWLAPDQEDTQQFVIRLPDDPLPVLTFNLRVDVTKGDRLVHARRDCKRDENDHCKSPVIFRDDPWSWTIEEGSLIYRLTRDPRHLVVDREPPKAAVPGPNGPGFPLTELVTCISRHRTCPEKFDTKLNALYGHVGIGASAQLLLDGAK